jgi:hypothetical protein
VVLGDVREVILDGTEATSVADPDIEARLTYRELVRG